MVILSAVYFTIGKLMMEPNMTVETYSTLPHAASMGHEGIVRFFLDWGTPSYLPEKRIKPTAFVANRASYLFIMKVFTEFDADHGQRPTILHIST